MPTTLGSFKLQAAIGAYGQPLDFVNTLGNAGIYVAETVQRYQWGQRLITVDGRVFKYSHSLGTLLSGFGAANIAPYNIGAVLPAAAAVGDLEVLVTIATTDGYAADGVLAKDELIGAYFIAGNGESLVQNRLILGNTAVATGGGTTTVKLDGPIANAMTISSSYCEIILNPYRYLSKGVYEYNAFMCVPAVNSASGYNFWGQTMGPAWVVPGGVDATPGNTVNDRSMYFVGDGSVNAGTSLTLETGYQYAGFIIEQTSSALSAAPLLMLQISC